MNSKTEASAIFLKAANYIRKYGWQERGMGKYGKPRCSMGALASAHPQAHWNPQVASLMYDALSQKLNGINLTSFNAKVNDGEEVAILFEKTARLIQEEI